LFDSTLNLKVHRAGGGSNETLGSRVDDLTTQILDRLFNGVGGHAVALAEDGDFLASKFHGFPLVRLSCYGCRSNITDMPSLS
jgi:hypothetical protein